MLLLSKLVCLSFLCADASSFCAPVFVRDCASDGCFIISLIGRCPAGLIPVGLAPGGDRRARARGWRKNLGRASVAGRFVGADDEQPYAGCAGIPGSEASVASNDGYCALAGCGTMCVVRTGGPSVGRGGADPDVLASLQRKRCNQVIQKGGWQ